MQLLAIKNCFGKARSLICLQFVKRGNAMHIMEGYLPFKHAAVWTLLSGVVVQGSLRMARKQVSRDRQTLLRLGAAIGFCFLLSSLKLPSVAGSSSHPTGIGLGTFLLGASMMPLVGLITLLFQAVLLAHGGLSTLGANTFSLAILGPLVITAIHTMLRKCRLHSDLSVVIATALGGMAVYACTSMQLALAFHDTGDGVMTAWYRFLLIFAPTQAPLSVVESILTLVCLKALGSPNEEPDYAARN
jgi:cobalt/nickel transport system permease protein